MRAVRSLGILAAIVACAAAARPASATTLERAGLERLMAENAKVVVGEVLDVQSRWNDDGTFILSDVRIAVDDAIKGKVKGREITVTVMGGTVDGLTSLIIGGAELAPGRAYVLFLNEENLPGAPRTLTVRDLCQGTFDLTVDGKGTLRALSQARHHALLPDVSGTSLAPGGAAGLEFTGFVAELRRIAARQARGEVRR